MGFSIRNKIGRWKLSMEVEKLVRVPHAINLQEAKSAVLVCQITSEEKYTEILEISNHLRKASPVQELVIVGYIPQKKIPSFIEEQVGVFYTKKDTDFWGIPNGEIGQKIGFKRYDLLLDFCDKSMIQTDYFLAILNAKSKVGRAGVSAEHIFDLLIEMSVKSSGLELSKNIFRYLEMINKQNK